MNKLIAGVDYVEAAELAAEATAKVAQQAMTAKRSTGAAQSDSSSDSDEEEGGGNGAALNATQELPGSPSGNVGMSSAKVASTKKIQDIQGSCLYQMAIPDSFTGKTYGKLFQHLSAQGMVPLGLLRGTFAGLSVGPKANRAPYVYTNPDKDVEIFKCDKVFVLSTKPIQANTKPTFKVRTENFDCFFRGSKCNVHFCCVV